MTTPISTLKLLSPLPTAYCMEWKTGVYHILTPQQFRDVEHKWDATIVGLYDRVVDPTSPNPFCFVHGNATIITKFSVSTMKMGDTEMNPLFLGPTLHVPSN
jgi:hypothetical protein